MNTAARIAARVALLGAAGSLTALAGGAAATAGIAGAAASAERWLLRHSIEATAAAARLGTKEERR